MTRFFSSRQRIRIRWSILLIVKSANRRMINIAPQFFICIEQIKWLKVKFDLIIYKFVSSSIINSGKLMRSPETEESEDNRRKKEKGNE